MGRGRASGISFADILSERELFARGVALADRKLQQ